MRNKRAVEAEPTTTQPRSCAGGADLYPVQCRSTKEVLFSDREGKWCTCKRGQCELYDKYKPSAGGAVSEADWRPIDTAPLDRSEVLICAANGIRVAYYDDRGFMGPGWFIPISKEPNAGGTYAALVTHWMPLPKRPSTAAKVREGK